MSDALLSGEPSAAALELAEDIYVTASQARHATTLTYVWEAADDANAKKILAFAAALAQAGTREARLEAALRPFSDMAGELFARNWNASQVVFGLDNPDESHRLTAADFFAVRAALTPEAPK